MDHPNDPIYSAFTACLLLVYKNEPKTLNQSNEDGLHERVKSY